LDAGDKHDRLSIGAAFKFGKKGLGFLGNRQMFVGTVSGFRGDMDLDYIRVDFLAILVNKECRGCNKGVFDTVKGLGKEYRHVVAT
jgi:hypothetical protein